MLITTSTSGMRSSASNSSASLLVIRVRRASPYFSFISSSSARTAAMISFGRADVASRSISLYRAMSLTNSLYSSSIFSRSSAVRRCNRISRIASACRSLSLNRFINPSRATGTSLDLRIRAMTSSRCFKATFRPCRICARSSARDNSNLVRRMTTVRRCFR